MASAIRVLAVASGGGHWVQLFRLRRAWEGCAVSFLTTTGEFRDEAEADAAARGEIRPRYYVVPEANRWQKLRLIRAALSLLLVMLRVRPHVVVSTGAAQGYMAIRLGKLMGARTIWVDSIANAGELSMSGKMAGKHADHWLTQWEDLARPEGPHFHGAVI